MLKMLWQGDASISLPKLLHRQGGDNHRRNDAFYKTGSVIGGEAPPGVEPAALTMLPVCALPIVNRPRRDRRAKDGKIAAAMDKNSKPLSALQSRGAVCRKRQNGAIPEDCTVFHLSLRAVRLCVSASLTDWQARICSKRQTDRPPAHSSGCPASVPATAKTCR